MTTVIDFSAAYPDPGHVKAAGHAGVMLYVSRPRESWMRGKMLTRQVVDRYRAAGIDVGFVFQYGGANAPDAMRGWDGGKADALEAAQKLREVGCDGWPVFFAVDFDATLDQWNTIISNYFRGAADVLGRARVGIYGHSRICHWAGPEDKLIADIGGGRWLAWVTRSWSAGETGRDYAALYQGKHNVPGPSGVQIDINTTFVDNWGCGPTRPTPAATPTPGAVPAIRPNPGHRGDPLFLPELLRAWGVKVAEYPGWRGRGHGDFGRILGIVCHHTAGASTPPSLIAHGHSALRGLLSQIHLAKDGTATICGAGVAWHAGQGFWRGWGRDRGNQVSIGIEAVNAGDGRDPWPAAQLDAYKRICAAICWYLGLDPLTDVVGHKEYSAQGKIDPHPIDMHQFRRDVATLVAHPPVQTQESEEEDMGFWDEKIPSLVDGAKKFARKDFLQLTDYHATLANQQSKQALDELKLLREDVAQLAEAITRATDVKGNK